MPGPSDGYRALEETLARERFGEVIISTLPRRVSAWLERDLPGRVRRLGVP
jgi:GABA permease